MAKIQVSLIAALSIAVASVQPVQARFLQVDPIGYQDQSNLYGYVGNDPLSNTDPKGTDAVMVTNPNGTRTLVIPVNFTGSGANIPAILAVANSITVVGSADTVQIVATSTPVQGVLNHMDVSPGYDYVNYPTAGEGQMPGPGPQGTGGNDAHINSSNGQANEAVVHDALHFSGIIDQYVEGPANAAGGRTSSPAPSYTNSNIMTSRSGNELNQAQFNAAAQNSTTRQCTVTATNTCN